MEPKLTGFFIATNIILNGNSYVGCDSMPIYSNSFDEAILQLNEKGIILSGHKTYSQEVESYQGIVKQKQNVGLSVLVTMQNIFHKI